MKNPKNKIQEIRGTVVSRAMLRECGYDGDMPTDDQLQTIADELLCYWHVSDGYADALVSTMENMFHLTSQ